MNNSFDEKEPLIYRLKRSNAHSFIALGFFIFANGVLVSLLFQYFSLLAFGLSIIITGLVFMDRPIVAMYDSYLEIYGSIINPKKLIKYHKS